MGPVIFTSTGRAASGPRVRPCGGGACVLEPFLDLASAAAGPRPPVEGSERRGLAPEAADGCSLASLVLDGLRRADRCLGDGDLDGAVRAVDTPWTWSHRELQGLARLAAAHLGRQARSPEEEWSKTLALVALCERFRPDGPRTRYVPHELWAPGLAWPPEKLERTFEAAREWLEEQGAGSARGDGPP